MSDKPIARVLLIMDRHKRDIDFSSIKGYCEASAAVTEDLLKVIEEYGITHAIEMGDLYDRGYTKLAAQYVDTMDDIAIRDAVHGNYYGLIGNHLMLERDRNPEFYLIQPNDYPELQPLIKRKFRTPIIRVVDDLVIGNTQISFFHYHKENKDYVQLRKPGIKHHIGLYHDDSVVPNSIRLACGISTKVSSEYLNRIYANIDFAFLGHIHTKVGMLKLKLKSGKIFPAYIQGALAMTCSKESEYHKTVHLPMIEIYEDDMKVKFIEVSLHTELMQIYKDEEKVTEDNQDKFIAVKTKKRFKIDAADVMKVEVCDTISQYLNTVDDTGQQLALFELALNKDLSEIDIDAILSNEKLKDVLEVEFD